MWWLCVLYSYLDASTEEYAEEEEVYTQGEEDHFDQYNNQGKLIHLQSAKLSRAKHLTICFIFIKPIPVLLQALLSSFTTLLCSSTFWFMIHLI